MRFCPHCDSELPERAKFCPACGTLLPAVGEPDSMGPQARTGTGPAQTVLSAPSAPSAECSDSDSKEIRTAPAVSARPVTSDPVSRPAAKPLYPESSPRAADVPSAAAARDQRPAAVKPAPFDGRRPKFNLHLDIWQGTRFHRRANVGEQRRQNKLERRKRTRLNAGDPPPAEGPRTPGRRRGAMITAILVLLIFALIVTGIVASIISRSQETQPYVLYQTDGYLKVVHVLSGQSVRLSAIGAGSQQKGSVPSWYYQTAENGTVLYFAVGDQVEDYTLKRVSYSDLFSGNDGVTTLTEHAQLPFVVNSAGQVFFCTTGGQLMQSDGRHSRVLAESVIDYRLNTAGNAVGYITADRTVSTVRIKDQSAVYMTCLDPADALRWVSETGETVYVERAGHLYAQSKDYSRLLVETYNQVEAVSANGAFYYTVDAEVTLPILELLTDRYQAEDASLKPPVYPLTNGPASPTAESEPSGSGTAGDEPAESRATTPTSSSASTASGSAPSGVTATAAVPGQPGTAGSGTAVSEPAHSARQHSAVLAALPWCAVRPVAAAVPGQTPTSMATGETAGSLRQDSTTSAVSGTTSGTHSGSAAASQTAAETASSASGTAQTASGSTLSSESERTLYETYRNEMDQYLKKLDRDAKRAALKDQTVTFMRSQLWYFDGSQAEMIDTGLDQVEAVNDAADTLIYRVSGQLGEKSADLSEIEDVEAFLTQVVEASERGYRLVNRGVCSTLAPAGYLSEVEFAEKGTHLIFVHGDDAALTNTYLESQVVFDTVMLDRGVQKYLYDESTGRILYYKSGTAGRSDLYEDSRQLYPDAEQALPVGKETLVLGGVDPAARQGTLARLIPNRAEPMKLDDHVLDVVRTSGLSGAYIRQDGDVYALVYNRKLDRRQILERSGQPIQFIRPLQIWDGQRIPFELPSAVLTDGELTDFSIEETDRP